MLITIIVIVTAIYTLSLCRAAQDVYTGRDS